MEKLQTGCVRHVVCRLHFVARRYFQPNAMDNEKDKKNCVRTGKRRQTTKYCDCCGCCCCLFLSPCICICLKFRRDHKNRAMTHRNARRWSVKWAGTARFAYVNTPKRNLWLSFICYDRRRQRRQSICIGNLHGAESAKWTSQTKCRFSISTEREAQTPKESNGRLRHAIEMWERISPRNVRIGFAVASCLDRVGKSVRCIRC